MSVVLCVAWHTVRGQHLERCDDPSCRGCLPAKASRGMHVCTGHELDVRDAVRDLPALWADLGDTRRSPGYSDGAGRGAGDPEACPQCDAGLPCDIPHRTGHEALSPARIAARSAIRATLVAWCRLLDEDLGVRLPAAPPDTVRWMAHHLAVSLGRVLANAELAERLVADMLGAQADGDGWEPGLMAHRQLIDSRRPPAGVRVQCPACESWVRLSDDDVIRCTGTLDDGSPCSEWGTIEHWRQLVAGDADHPMTGPELVAWLGKHHRYRCTEETLRQWASRGTRFGKLTRVGEDDEGRTLYDPVRAAELVMLGRSRNAG